MFNGDDRKAKGWIAGVEEWYSGKTKSANQTKGDKRLKHLIRSEKTSEQAPKKPRNANNPTAALQYRRHRKIIAKLAAPKPAIRKSAATQPRPLGQRPITPRRWTNSSI
ncbi:MAG: hypothetical protein CM1200mP34_4850 [Verrucomicrobiales bacterium]|nr:MAG: hypothetical protein CM1200mP34_4850 [Verrucomicrobiales bacterium]